MRLHSNKKVWWLCKNGHEWQATITHRSGGGGCPYCSGRFASEEDNLQVLNPGLAKEWHPFKNGNLTPKDVRLHSNKKVWWLCKNGHEWKAAVSNRSSGRGCPYCSGRFASEEDNLQVLNPGLAKEWHPFKNGNLTPKGVRLHSNKKVWWVCKRKHEWEARITDRSRGNGCPYCSSQTSQLELRIYTEMKYLFENVAHRKKLYGIECDIYVPELRLALEVDGLYWHKNKHLKDKEKTNSLQKNGIVLIRLREKGLEKVSEDDIIFSAKDDAFNLLRRIGSRLLKLDNVQMDLRHKIEQYFKVGTFANNDEYLQLLYLLPAPLPGLSLSALNEALGKEWHPTKNASLAPNDVSIGSHLKVWWICKKGHEWRAEVKSRNKGSGCPYCSGKLASEDYNLQRANPNLAKQWHPAKNGILSPKDVTPSSEKKVWWICKKGHEWRAEVSNRNQGRGCPYCSGKLASEKHNLQVANPDLAEEWHPTKNGILSPKDVTPGSEKKVWWICKKGHEWQATIDHRNKGSGCPYCRGGLPTQNYNLRMLNPDLAREWHPRKNEDLTPEGITPYSNKKVWWVCRKGHEWKAVVSSRSEGTGCPYCANQAVFAENCLQTVNPFLAREWHPTRNDRLSPKDVLPGSNKKVWWICHKGHEWKALISNRNKGAGCPYCTGRAVCIDNCLQTLNPDVAKEWHPIRNKDLKPNQVTPGSDKNVWWICDRGHEWKARIAHRNNGSGCPHCYRRKSNR